MVYTVTGYETLKDGRCLLVLKGNGTDNGKPSENQVTLTIRRNLLEILEESHSTGSNEPMAFRHAFRFTRGLRQPLPVPINRRSVGLYVAPTSLASLHRSGFGKLLKSSGLVDGSGSNQDLSRFALVLEKEVKPSLFCTWQRKIPSSEAAKIADPV